MKKLTMLVFAIALSASLAFAANGDGTVVSYSPTSATTNVPQDITVEFLNDGTACLDELIFTAPATWGGVADVSSWSRGTVAVTNEADDGTRSGLVADLQSVRITSTSSNKILCAGEKVIFTITGLTTPTAPETSTFAILTSDVNSNEPSVSAVRAPIDPPQVVIRITSATDIQIRYIQRNSFGAGSGVEHEFTATAKGGWGRLEQLHVRRTSGTSTTADVYMDNGDGIFNSGTDFLVADNAAIGPSLTTIDLTYTAAMDIPTKAEDGFIKDAESVKYFIDLNSGGALTILGQRDVVKMPDPSSIGTGFEATTEGTVISVGGQTRTIFAQLVNSTTNSSGVTIWLDVLDDAVKVFFTTDLGSFNDPSPKATTNKGQVELSFVSGTVKGIAHVVLSVDMLTGSDSMDEEFVGINAGPAASWDVTEGDGASVPAGSLQRIEVTIYDQYGNVITNVPNRPDVSFDLLSSPPGAGLDDDDIPDGFSSFHDELADQGIGDANLKTSTQTGDHEVEICVTNPSVPNVDTDPSNCKTITITGVTGAPARVIVEAPPVTTADACIEATVTITDEFGNVLEEYIDPITGHAQQWSSLVRVELTHPLPTDHEAPFGGDSGITHITDSDFLEEEILDDGQAVQGKLTNGMGTVTICGCQGLGIFDIEAFSDTLEPGVDFVSVINAPPSCVALEFIDPQCEEIQNMQQCAQTPGCAPAPDDSACLTIDENLLACQPEAQIDVGILDVCGNYVVDQECPQNAIANTCVTFNVTDPSNLVDFSTNTVCVDLSETGHTPTPVDMIRNSEMCGTVTIDVLPQQQCCPSGFPTNLTVCEPLVVTLIGEPARIITEFEAERNGLVIPDKGSDIVSEPIYDNFYALDACQNIVEDFNGEVDVQLKGEDCVSFIEVDSPADLNVAGQYCTGQPACSSLTQQGQAVCQDAGCSWDVDTCEGTADANACDDFTFDECWETINQAGAQSGCRFLTDAACELDDEDPVFKLVVDNCAQEGKQWTDLEKDDIMVDKLAFTISAPDYDFDVEIYQESEETPGFQSNEDILVGRAPANNIDSLTGGVNAPQGLTVAELAKANPYFGADWYSRGTEEDGGAGPEREGGVLVRAGDTTDFYVVLDPDNGDVCGVYDVNFAFYQDYTNADIIDREFSGYGEDYDLGRDDHNYVFDGVDSRNEFYQGEEYGFGDKFLNNLDFENGVAWIKFRDLTAETVQVWSSDVQLSGTVCDYQDEAELGTCYVRNGCSGPLMDDVTAEDCQDVRGESWRSSSGVCSDLPQEDMSLINVVPNPETITFAEQLATQVVMINHDGFDAKTVGMCIDGDLEFDPENAFLVNLQTADGFQNPHAKSLPVTLDSCLAWEFFDFDAEGEIFTDIFLSERFDWDNDHCVDKEEFRQMLEDDEVFEGFADYFHEVLFADFFGSEYTAWIDNYFTNAKVEFYNLDGTPVVNNVIMTNANGQAQFYAASKYAGFYRITATPYALDADYTFVNFEAGDPESLDIISVPGFGVPADGEQEAQLWVRALDSCGNIIEEDIDNVTVTALGDQDNQVVISEDFDGENNYDNNVTGTLEFAGGFLGKWFGADKTLRVLDDFPETATITASSPGLIEDTTTVVFQGAPVKLEIVSITPSDRLPADGETGAWMTIEVQDSLGHRVTGYLGGGFAGDPGDTTGLPDYRFDEICIDLDDADASLPPWLMDVDDSRFGVISISQINPSQYCFDILFGRGSLYITYGNEWNNHGGRIEAEVWDALPWQGQEINENGLPASEKTTQLDPAYGSIDYVDPATRWDVTSDQQVVLADGISAAQITVQVENDFMDVRNAIMGSLYVGGTAESGVTVSWNGDIDELNPTKARFMTDPVTGQTMLLVTSTEPGTAEITVVGGDAYVCEPNDFGVFGFFEGVDFRWLNPDLLDPMFEKEYRNCGYSNFKDLTPETITIEFLEVANNQLSLVSGWNFVSVPFALQGSPNASTLFPTATGFYAWNEGTQTFTSSMGTVIQPLNGYWVEMPAPTVATLTYAPTGVQTPPTKNVVAGWNTVGLSLDSPMVMENALISIDPMYTSVIDWNEMIQKYALPVANVDGISQFTTGGATMEPKQGYWIWVTSPGMLQGWAV
ncbi:MAG TPA: hypothetical protein VI968_00800 [archaeon]|nr:hypothetical protein [archaeon]